MIATLLLSAAAAILPLPASPVGANPPGMHLVQAEADNESSERAKPLPSRYVAQTTVGMRIRLRDLHLPGSQLRAKPVLDPGKADAVVRIKEVKPHGSDFRYDLEVTPFVAGVLDIRAMLERENGATTADLPPLTLLVEEVLAPGVLTPGAIEDRDPGRFGGYWNLMIFASIAWVVGLCLILYLGFRRKRKLAEAQGQGGTTLAERLEPMVEAAQRGNLSDSERAGLERLLFAYWREKRGLGDMNVSHAMAQLREDEEAGPLLQQLERWLHDPHAGSQSVDLQALLEPYRLVAADDIDADSSSYAASANESAMSGV